MDSEDVLTVKGIGGNKLLLKVADMAIFGKVHMLSSTDKINILSFSWVDARYKVDYIQGEAFKVRINDDLVIRFDKMNDGLWGCNFRKVLDKLRKKNHLLPQSKQ